MEGEEVEASTTSKLMFDRTLSDYDEVTAVLEKELNELRSEVSKLTLDSKRVEREKLDVDDSIPEERQILLNRERRLKAQIQVYSTADPQVEPTNEKVCDLMIEEVFAKLMSNMNVLNDMMEDQKKEVTNEIKKLDIKIERDLALANTLEENINQLTTEKEQVIIGTTDSSKENVIKLQDKIKRTAVAVRRVTNDMMKFLDEHFASPTPMDDVASTPESQASDVEFAPLGEIIEALLTAYVDRPHDCYLDVADDWWPKHVEMLLLHDIIVQHPLHANRVRLEFYDS